ncbi:MAG TPA: carboxypeptidase-like regulatory domain-containing protein, partial [Marinilabiliaceae bacterium]|nr:carboxypeptidase-like regulatory domain-containing protein [Marinilabiliaceae bacterium]
MKKMLNGQRILLLLLGFMVSFGAYAQEVTVTGKVIDQADRMGLPGVTVVVKETQQGTITTPDGSYSLVAQKGDVLVFSFIGYANQEVVVGDATTINIAMVSDMIGLDEVVVIGYGVQRRSDRTGAVTQVKAEDLNKGSLTDPIQSLQGKASGVTISKQGGDPNAGFSVNIRGASGFQSNTQPLYVIDGVPGVDPTTVSSQDIATFDVLKDAASTAIYGSRGSNGVIIITTKSGKDAAGRVNFSATLTIDQVANTLGVLSAGDYRQFVSDNNLTGSFI